MTERLLHLLRGSSQYLLCAVLLAVVSHTAAAGEPHLEFLDGLRRRGYHDYALTYLDRISQESDLPADVREVLPYERALTLLEGVKTLTNSKTKREQLDAAQAAFEQFAEASPNHPLAGRANTETAKIFMERARVEIWDAEDPANTGSRATFQQRARELIQQARTIFETALEQHKAEVDKFPLQIPEEEKVLRKQREEAEGRYLRAVLHAVECTYWTAQTYDRDSEQRTQLLEQAAVEYADVHAEHRLQMAGLLARLWQGKCFEEMDLLGEALGIYNEFIKHEGTSQAMTELKARALRFKLICLNYESRHDYKVVIDKATEWLKDAGPMARTDIGMGIRFEMARAQEMLGMDRTSPAAAAENYLTQARLNARNVARYPGELKAPALALVRRVAAATGRPEEDPKDFETAYGLGAQYISDTSKINNQIEQAQSDGRTDDLAELLQSRELTAAEATRLFDIALRLVDDETDPRQLATARRQLSYGYFLQDKFYESAVAADYALLHLSAEYDDIAQVCAYLEMSAYDYAYTEADPEHREFEERRIMAAAERLIERWPDSDYATYAHSTIARMFVNRGETASAAKQYAKVRSTAKDYPESQILAGSAYLDAYNTTVAQPEEERQVDTETLNGWRAAAEAHLETGVTAWQAQLPQDADPPRQFTLGKLSLVGIRNLNGVYTTTDGVTGAIELLTDDPHSVLKAVEVAPGEDRPADPSDVKSARNASFAYQQLLRAYIGIRNLEAASEARVKLEQAAAGEDSAALTAVYVAFGRELQREMSQLLASGQSERLEDVRSGFEEFLDSISEREDQTYNSLFWMAETYTSLGEGSGDAPARAETFFAKAGETYQRMLADSSLLSGPGQGTAVKLRLANCRRRSGDFPAGEEVLLEAVGESSNVPNVQFEAALFYEQWAESSSAEWQKYEIALDGTEDRTLWGWSELARRLQNALLKGNADKAIEQMHLNARYHQAHSLRQYGLQQTDAVESAETLHRAKYTVEALVRITAKLPADDFRRFDELYQAIRADLGEESLSLSAALAESDPTRSQPAGTPGPDGSPSTSPTGTAVETTDQPEGPQTNVFMIVLLAVVGIGAVVGLYFLAVGQDTRRHRKAAAASAARPAKAARKSR